jgi:two-component system, LytTR family, response regulator LytT
MKIVIIEDEQNIADALEHELMSIDPSIEILTKLASVKESLVYFQSEPVFDLIFSDIELSDGLSFSLFKQLELKVPIVFCTAHDEYALEAFKANGIDYILKPFTRADLVHTLDKLKMLSSPENTPVDFQLVSELIKKSTQKPRSILVYKKDYIQPIHIEDISICYSENEQTYMLTAKNERFTSDKTLGYLEEQLGDDFYRVNRQYIVNREAILKVSKYFGRKLSIHLHANFDQHILVPKNKVMEFLKWLEA